ncbi:hypothetical protein K2173_021937 [Erythroxylum novogranatense]|uniref:DUF4283 domain-containing protein n=1 Tax=Erythroxylum novogranatense TaxID=1862640 RepID=A0AAV8T3J7_9ROSI|nr:hypothetical protein K2173_021937 [Erythroxylum novogranatense]
MSLGPFPPLPSKVAVDSPSASRAMEEGDIAATPPVGRGAWRDMVGKSKSVGKMQFYPNVLQDGVVSPPLELLQAGARVWSHALVGFFWSKRVAFPVVSAWARRRWGKQGFEKAMLRSDGSVLFKFSPNSNLGEILEQGPWHIGDQPLFLQQWRPGLGVDRGAVDAIPLWVLFHDLPMEYWTVEGLSHLASGLGKPLCMDAQMASMDRIGYAKICIAVSKDAELSKNLSIKRLGDNGELLCARISLSYPWKPQMGGRKWVATGRVFNSCWAADLDQAGSPMAGEVLPHDSRSLNPGSVDSQVMEPEAQIVTEIIRGASSVADPVTTLQPIPETVGVNATDSVACANLGEVRSFTPSRADSPLAVVEGLPIEGSATQLDVINPQVREASVEGKEKCFIWKFSMLLNAGKLCQATRNLD